MMRIVIDTSYIAYRAMHSLGALEANDTPTGTLYGFLLSLLELGQRFQTTQFIFAFDSPTNEGVRRKAYPDYKVKRHADDTEEEKIKREAVRKQLDLLRTSILPSLGFKDVFYFKGFESDDIIAAMVGRDGKRLPIGCTVEDRYVIVSADHDFYQLLEGNGRVVMYNISTKEIYTAADLLRIWDCLPDQWVWILACAGCDTDEVKGLTGIGFKSAISYLLGKTTARKKQLIESSEGEASIERNRPLVLLPHPLFPWDMMDVKGTQFTDNGRGFRRVCDKYKFQSFLREPLFSQWKNFFLGKFDVRPVIARSFRTPPQRALGMVSKVVRGGFKV